MENLSLKEFRITAKDRSINGYKSIPKDILLRIINNNNWYRKSLFKSKKEETKKGLYKPTKSSLFKLKGKKLRKVFTRNQRNSLWPNNK